MPPTDTSEAQRPHAVQRVEPKQRPSAMLPGNPPIGRRIPTRRPQGLGPGHPATQRQKRSTNPANNQRYSV